MTRPAALPASRPARPGGPETGARPPRVGVLGDGQLARMMAPAAAELDVELHLLAGSAEASAAQVIARTTLGDHRSVEDVLAFAAAVDVVTFDHEHVPDDVLAALAGAAVPMHPGPQALVHAQDKLSMRRAVERLDLPNPRWAAVSSVEELVAFGEEAGWPVVLKTPRGGYDGKGVRVVDAAASADEAADWFSRAAEQGTPLLAEEKVPYTRELSAQVARSAAGEVRVYPVVESLQTDGVCDVVTAPAPVAVDDREGAERLREAAEIAATLAEELDVTGMLAVELFEIADGERAGVHVNELAMRPHNSGHWSMDGAVTGQFEQHLRAVLGLPLGATDPIAGPGSTTVMKNILGGAAEDLHAEALEAMRAAPTAKIHLYGKQPRPGRKIGHVTVVAPGGETGADVAATRRTAEETARRIAEGTESR
ncbi:5-(carboxyamino)imidazole ribonucleotide synthase [Nesterenkonia halophila]